MSSTLLMPIKVRSMTLSNRLVMPPMATAKSNPGGEVSQAMLDYYDEKSKGGYLSLVIIEHSYVSPEGKASNNQLSAADDSMTEALGRLAEAIRRNGSKAVMQLNHAGSSAKQEIIGTVPVGPSTAMNPNNNEMPRELSKEEMAGIVLAYQNAAKRVKQAGFDGVEIHSAHGYLLNQFFSPLTNKRNDEYGGSVENRIRLHLEIIKAVRGEVGTDFPILLRLGASDYMEGGITIEDSKTAAIEFEKAGVDLLDISGGMCRFTIPGVTGQGYFAPLTEALKQVVSIPVILTGGVTEVQAAERLLDEGKADLIGVGRAVYNDSGWARRAVESLMCTN